MGGGGGVERTNSTVVSFKGEVGVESDSSPEGRGGGGGVGGEIKINDEGRLRRVDARRRSL